MITFTLETADNALEAMKPLFPLHYEELTANKHFYGQIDPDVEAYRQAEKNGALFALVVRDGDSTIGYYVAFLHRNMHYRRVLMASEDTYFLHPDYRKKGIGKVMFDEVEKKLKEAGVHITVCKTRDAHDNSAFLMARRYGKADRLFMKILNRT